MTEQKRTTHLKNDWENYVPMMLWSFVWIWICTMKNSQNLYFDLVLGNFSNRQISHMCAHLTVKRFVCTIYLNVYKLTHIYRTHQSLGQSYHSRVHTTACLLVNCLWQCRSYLQCQKEMLSQSQSSVKYILKKYTCHLMP